MKDTATDTAAIDEALEMMLEASTITEFDLPIASTEPRVSPVGH